jgi:uncharacterized iron-regulated membrane protein
MMIIPSQDASEGRANTRYFTAWRWHFYAGIYVVPFLMMLAVTGLIMLWTAALSGLHGDQMRVVPTGAVMQPAALATAAAAVIPGGVVTQYVEPLTPDRVALIKVQDGEAAQAVLVNPYTGAVVDHFAWDGGWYDFASTIHGTLMIGTLGDRLIEIAASLGLILVASGLYLHWPRDKGWRGALLPSLSSRGRALWKSLHGVVGFWMSAVMVVFLISGLSWTGIWGEKIVQAWSTFPAEKWDNVPLSDKVHATMNHGAEKTVPWTLEQTPLPQSGSLAGVQAVSRPVTLDSVVGFAKGLGFAGRFQINLPADEAGVWTISHDTMSNDGHDPTGDRTLHIDQYTGNVLADVRFADYSAYAAMMAVGISFHEGDLGVWNLILNTVFCAAMIFLPVSGLVLWWKRRPDKAMRLAAPPAPRAAPHWKGAVILVAILGCAFPLAGLTIVAVIAIDYLILRQVPRLRRALT